jgi:PKD repeat protein
MQGYISRDDATVVLTQAVLVQSSTKYGSLQVLIEPAGARSAGAQWRRVGTSTWYNSDYVETGIAVGTHTVEFKTVTGWVTPANAGVSIVENQTAGLSGTYTEQGGTVIVDVTPDEAWWSLSGPAGFEGNGTFYAGDWTFNNAPPGSYTWTAQYQLPNYDAPSPGTQSLSVGGSITFYKAWTQTPPVAGFSATSTQGISPLTVSFTDLSTGTIHTRMWNFGDGSPVSYETNPTHIYQNPGTYQATLTVAGPLPSSPTENATFTMEITVNHTPPVARFTMDRFRGESPLQVNFTDQSTGEITLWSWTFKAGETSAEQHPQQTFNDLGVYTVKLDVTGPGGTSMAEATVIVYNTLYVNQNDDACGGKAPCFTSIQEAMDAPDQVKMIKVTQGTYQEEIQHTQSHTAIIQGGNDAAFQSTPSGTKVTKLTGTGGTLILENIIMGLH